MPSAIRRWYSDFLIWSAPNSCYSTVFRFHVIRRVRTSVLSRPAYCSGTSGPTPMESSRNTKSGLNDERRELERCHEEISRLKELVLRLSEIVLRNVLKSTEQPKEK
jgi:hypothetical protein